MRIDTSANDTSIICIIQFRACCSWYRFSEAVNSSVCRVVRGVGGTSRALGSDTIRLLFTCLGVVIDVKFLVVLDDIPALLYMKDMLADGPHRNGTQKTFLTSRTLKKNSDLFKELLDTLS